MTENSEKPEQLHFLKFIYLFCNRASENLKYHFSLLQLHFIITTTKHATKSSIMPCPYYIPENVSYAGIVLLPGLPHSIKTAFAVNVSRTSELNPITTAFARESSERMISYWLLCWNPDAASKAPLVKRMERINCSLGFHSGNSSPLFYTPDYMQSICALQCIFFPNKTKWNFWICC